MCNNIWLLILGFVCVACAVGLRADTEAEGVADRYKQLEMKSAAEKDELRRKQERFEKLSPDEREKLRHLEETLAKDDHGERLREVMLRYHDWMRSLPTTQRTEILSAPPDQRIEKIKQRLAEQEKRRREELAMQSITGEDIDKIRNWMKPIFKRSESNLLAKLSDEQRKRCDRTKDLGRFGAVLGAALWNQRFDTSQWRLDTVMGITEAERQELVSSLSATAQEAYKRSATDDTRRQLVESWMRAAVFREIKLVPPHELRRFADRVDPKTPNHWRDQLDYLPRHQVQAEIEGVFRDRSKGPSGSGFPPYNFPKGDPRERSRSGPPPQDDPPRGDGKKNKSCM